jgi:hypothetical protein
MSREQTQPQWVTLGLKDLVFHETGNNRGIEKFIAQAHCGRIGDPWCAIWASAKLEQSGIKGTRSASSSQSTRTRTSLSRGDFRKYTDWRLKGPALGHEKKQRDRWYAARVFRAARRRPQISKIEK